MIIAADRQAIATFLTSLWQDEWGKVAWPNDNFTIPSNGRWATVAWIESDSSRASLGNDFLVRTYGFLQIDLYEPDQGGTVQQLHIAEAIHDAFMELVLPTGAGPALEFQVPNSRIPAPNEVRASNLEDNWSRLTISIPFIKNQGFIK
jgi:hypothetical protein